MIQGGKMFISGESAAGCGLGASVWNAEMGYSRTIKPFSSPGFSDRKHSDSTKVMPYSTLLTKSFLVFIFIKILDWITKDMCPTETRRPLSQIHHPDENIISITISSLYLWVFFRPLKNL